MIKINLLPPEYAASQAKKEQRLIFGSLGGFLAFILIFVWMAKESTAGHLTEEIKKQEAELQKYRTIVAEIQRNETFKKTLSAKRDVIKDLNRSRLDYPVLLEDFLPILPDIITFLILVSVFVNILLFYLKPSGPIYKGKVINKHLKGYKLKEEHSI